MTTTSRISQSLIFFIMSISMRNIKKTLIKTNKTTTIKSVKIFNEALDEVNLSLPSLL